MTPPPVDQPYDEDDDYDPYDDWSEEDDEDEDGDEPAIMTCPACGEEVIEDTQQCPHCGDWIVPVDPREESHRFVWALVVVFLLIALVVLTVR